MASSPRLPFTTTSTAALAYDATSASDAPVQFDQERLTNTTRFPVEIREIRICARMSMVPGGPALFYPSDPSVALALEGKLGQNYITDGLVPMSVLAPYRYHMVYLWWNTPCDDIYTVNTAFITVANRRIVLRKPVYLRPGVGFRFQAAIPITPVLQGIIGQPFTINAYVTLVGRYMAPTDSVPRQHEVPFFSYAWASQAKRVTLEGDLNNPLTKPLTVTRLVGARVRVTHDGTGDRFVPLGNFATATTVEITNPELEKLSEDPINFPNLFGQAHTLPYPKMLGVNERIRARLGVNANDAEVAGTSRVIYQFALHGYRSEVVP